MEIIDSMVNFETLELKGQDPDSEISFPTSTHQKFFNVLLVDFLSFIVQIAASPLSVNPPVVTAFSSGASIAGATYADGADDEVVFPASFKSATRTRPNISVVPINPHPSS
jgi:hypothetical protein